MLWCTKVGLINGKSGHRLAPEDTISTAEAVLILQRAAQLPDIAQLREDLETLSTQHRPIGSAGEQAAVEHLKKRFTENGKKGSRYYTSTLSEDERNRMIGDIQLDMLGGFGSSGSMVCTMDGEANWLSDLLVMQNARGYLYHSAADTSSYIDLYTLAGTAQTVASVIQEIADINTPSYRDKATLRSDLSGT